MKSDQNEIKGNPIPVRLGPEEEEFLRSLSEKTGLGYSHLIRHAVRIYIDYAKKHNTLPIELEQSQAQRQGRSGLEGKTKKPVRVQGN